MWGFQLAFFLVQGPFLLAVYVLRRDDWRPWVRVLIAAALCLVATFSMVQGIFAWIVLAVAVWPLGRVRRERWAAVGCWVAIAAVVIGCYFVGFSRPEIGDDPNYALNHPVAAAFATFGVLGGQYGRTFGRSGPPSVIFGFVTVVAFVGGLGVAWWRRVAYATWLRGWRSERSAGFSVWQWGTAVRRSVRISW